MTLFKKYLNEIILLFLNIISNRNKGFHMNYDDFMLQLKQMYPNKLLLTKKEVAYVTRRSLSTLNRDIAFARGINYKKTDGRVLYPIHEVAKWMSDLEGN